MGGQPLTRAGRLARALGLFACALLLLVPPVLAQTAQWEALSPIREPFLRPNRVASLGLLRGEGALAADPAADTLVAFTFLDGTFLYNPSGAAGAAGDNRDFGDWHELCPFGLCGAYSTGIITSSNTMIVGLTNALSRWCRATGRGRDWTCGVDPYVVDALHESHLPFPESTTGEPTVFLGTSLGGVISIGRSFGDGAADTWETRTVGLGDFLVFGEAPPSPQLPRGRLLAGTFNNGILYADDGGLTWHRSNVPVGYFGRSLTFAPVEGHPYGGVVFAGLDNFNRPDDVATAEAWRSDDGGVTWEFVHRFSSDEIGRPDDNAGLSRAFLYATPDGSVWAGVGYAARSSPSLGSILRSTDMGQTWQRADAGYGASPETRYRVNNFLLARDGRLYVAHEQGVSRTLAPVVSAEAPAASGTVPFSVSVRPNPSGGRVEVVLRGEARDVRIVVVDARGREVATVTSGPLSGERAVQVGASRWVPGVYVVRASAGGQTASTGLTIAR